MPAGPSESELRAALETLLEAADLSTLSYSQLHKQLEEKFAVSDICTPYEQYIAIVHDGIASMECMCQLCA
mgnify:CR=1 FL=1